MFDNERMRLGRRVLQANHSPLAQQYAKKGCPGGLRAELWASMLGVATDDIVSTPDFLILYRRVIPR